MKFAGIMLAVAAAFACRRVHVKNTLFKLLLGLFLFACITPAAFAQQTGALNAVYCNGASQYISVATNTWFNGNFTIEGWVNVRTYNNWSRLIDFGNGPITNEIYFALTAGGNGTPTMGVLNVNSDPILSSPVQIPTNQWVHLACTLSNTTGTIYINGTAVTSGTISIPPNAIRTNNYIGRSLFSQDSYANASFDEVRIWNVARTPAQIQAFMHRSLAGTESNLVGYWRFDEGSGTTVADATVQGHPATLVNGVTWTNSRAVIAAGMGEALSYNSSQFADITNRPALDAFPLTIMTWFRATNGPGFPLVSKYVSASLNGYNLFIAGGGDLNGWYFINSANKVYPLNAGIVADGNWHHAAMVIDSAGGRLYVDGVQKSSLGWTGTAGPTVSTQDIYFNLYQGDSLGVGQQDEVSIWNTNLTQAQIQNYMTNLLVGNEPGLLGYWRMDEGAGTNLTDYTGHGYNATLTGNPAWIASGVPNVFPDPAYALNLAGTNNAYVQIPSGVWFNGDFTVEGWVYARSYQNWSRLFEFADGPNTNDVFLTLSSGTSGKPVMGVYLNNNGSPNFTANTQLPLNQWVHLACTLSNTTGTIYINGTNVGSGTLNRPPNVVRSNNYVGRSAYPGDSYADAIVDEFRIWNVARTQLQIRSNMRHALVGTESNLIGYWRFDDGWGTNIVDATGNGNNASFTNGPAWVISTNKFGSAPTLVGNPSAINITSASASLVGSINPNGLDSIAYFEWGTTTNYGITTSLTPLSATNVLAGVTNLISGLTPGTLYHFHLVVYSGGGLTISSDQVFTSASTPPSVTTLAAINFLTNGATMNGSVNPNGANTAVWFEWGTTTTYGTSNAAVLLSATNIPIAVSNLTVGLLPGTLYHFHVVASNSVGTTLGSDLTFTTLGAVPSITGEFVGDINTNAATLNGSVSPNYLPTVAWFEWGTDTNYGNTSAIFPVSETNNTAFVALSNAITGLYPGTTYHFHLVTTNILGMTTGNDATFAALGTPPSISGEFASDLNTNSATLNGSVAPNYLPTTAWFEWGPDMSYGNVSATFPVSETNYTTPVALANPISGLNPGTLYHFHVVATNILGTTPGNDATFMTLGGLPIIGTEYVSATTTNAAMINAFVAPNYVPAVAWFEWGSDTNYGNTSAILPVSETNGASQIEVSNVVSGLTPHSTYHFHLVASNFFGATIGGDTLLVSAGGAPQIGGLFASPVSSTNATLNANVNPNYFSTAGWFEFSNSVGNTITNYFSNIGDGSMDVGVSTVVSNLTATNTYLFRVAATNVYGTNYSSYQSFETVGPPQAATTGLYTGGGTFGGYYTEYTGSVIPNGLPTYAWFEWATVGSFTNTTPVNSFPSYFYNYGYQYSYGGLPSAGILYSLRAVASNSLGVSYGTNIYYSSPVRPTVQMPSLNYSTTNITFHAVVNTGAAATGVYFEWGPGSTRTAVTNLPATNGYVTVNITVPYSTNLTAFAYRVIAANSAGGTVSPFQLFTYPTMTLTGANPAIFTCSGSAAAPIASNSTVVVGIAGGYDHGAAIEGNTAGTWGTPVAGYSTPFFSANIVQIAAGDNFTFAITAFGQLNGWGPAWSSTPSFGGSPLFISGRWTGCAAVCANNVAYYWNGVSPLTSGTWTPPAPQTVTSTSIGYQHIAFLTDQGHVYAVGDNTYGQCNIANVTGVANQIACGNYFSLALISNSVYGAGDNSYGESVAPAAIQHQTTAIAAGRYHSMALLTNGTVIVWGNNTDGETNVPAGLNNVIAIAAGGFSCYALKNNGQIVGWGDNAYGETNTPTYSWPTFLGTVRSNVTSSLGTNIISYGVTNIFGFSASAVRTVVFQDPLTFSLTGSNVVFVPDSVPYTDPGYTAMSTCLGNISNKVVVTGTVNTSMPGSYLLTYSVTNSVGITNTLLRAVIVDHPTQPVLSLQLPPGASPTIRFTGTLGLSYTLQDSTDLVNWTSLSNILASPATNLSITPPLSSPAPTNLFFRVTFP